MKKEQKEIMVKRASMSATNQRVGYRADITLYTRLNSNINGAKKNTPVKNVCLSDYFL